MEKAPEQRRILVKIGEKEVDFTDVPPITGADKKVLKKAGVDFTKLGEMEVEQEATLLLHLVRKVHPDATGNEVDALPVTIQAGIISHFMQSTKDVKNPFDLSPLSQSMSSHESMAGAKKS